jgi:hypothetical protein
MSDKQDQKKKDGQNKNKKNKKNERMHADVNARHKQAEATAAGDPHQRDRERTNRSGTKS